MQKVMISILLGMTAMQGRSQDAIETMMAQLAALHGYLNTAEAGYAIAEEGLDTIGVINDGEYGLHRVYFGSLVSVHAPVRNMPAVSAILQSNERALHQLASAMKRYRWSSDLSAEERGYLERFYAAVTASCRNNDEILEPVLTDGTISMDDGQRIDRIVVVQRKSDQLYQEVAGLISTIDRLIASRQVERRSIETVKTFYKQP